MKIIYFTPAVIWFVVSIILLTLPANDLPHSRLFDLPDFDKLVHFGMFFLLTVLFSYPFSKSLAEHVTISAIFNKIACSVILYGIIMEFVQKYFTVGRTFDITDILFDALGTGIGLLAIRQHAFKKIGPNKNRGRNQN
jgi:VanZ family protein